MHMWLVFASILIGLTAFAEPRAVVGQKEIALHIAVIDHMAFSRAAFDEVDAFVTENLPSRRLRSVAVEASVLRSNREKIRAELLAELKLAPGDRVGHLIIDTHGTTLDGDSVKETDQAAGLTRLAYLGDFGANGVDGDLAAILEPLRGHLSPNLVIVLNSCSTLCGSTPDAAARVAGLLKSVGAPNAQVYGSTTPEVESPGALIGRSRWRDYFGDAAQLRLFTALGLAVGVPFSALDALSHGHSPTIFGVSTAVAATAASLYSISTVMKAALAKFGRVNLGRLLVFRNGRFVRGEDVRKFDDRLEIYGTCSSLFGAGL